MGDDYCTTEGLANVKWTRKHLAQGVELDLNNLHASDALLYRDPDTPLIVLVSLPYFDVRGSGNVVKK